MSNPFLAILANHLWQSLLVAAVLGGLTLLLRRNSARVRYFLWLAASLKFLVPFAALAVLGTLIPWQPQVDAPGDIAPRILEAAGTVAMPLAIEVPFPRVDPPAQASTVAQTSTWAFFIWLTGAVFVLGRWLLRWLVVWRALRRSAVMTNVDFPVPVRATQEQFEPGVVGVFRPKLILPAGIEQRLTSEQLRAVLAHERCHLRWRDNFTASLHMFVETVFWFFPPVWWIGARLIEERERDCDEQVVRDGHAPESYAEGILNVCEHYIASRLPCVSGVSGADLRKRIENIVKRTLGLKLTMRRKLALVAVSCCVLTAPLAAGMISGNAYQMIGGSDLATMVQYWQVRAVTVKAQTTGRSSGNPSICTYPEPAAGRSDEQRHLAAMVAKLPATHEKALLYAIAANNTAEVRRLLAAGAPRSGDGHIWSDSLMHTAAEMADPEMLQLLADSGFDINERSQGGIAPRGGTPLMTAISSNNLKNARWLISHGAEMSATNKHNQSALLFAMLGCHDPDLVALLLKAGAKPDAVALRVADNRGIDLRTDKTLPGPPLQSWLPQRPGAEASADYDGDGRLDQVSLRLSVDGRWAGVFVRLSSRNPGEWMKAAEVDATPSRDARTMTVATALAGAFAKACASGGRPRCAADEVRAITLKQPGIRFYQPRGDTDFLVYWDDSGRRFRQVWVSD